jgi:hypothetical protein
MDKMHIRQAKINLFKIKHLSSAACAGLSARHVAAKNKKAGITRILFDKNAALS